MTFMQMQFLICIEAFNSGATAAEEERWLP